MSLFNVGLPNQPDKQPVSSPGGMPAGIFDIQGTAQYTVPADGWLDVLVLGAGGSGGVAYDSTATATRALGGAGGGLAFKRAAVRAGQVITFTLGAGGASVSRAATGTTNGNAGGTTTVVGGAFNITVPGGPGGVAASGTAALNPTVVTAPTGGDMNIASSQPGAISAITGAYGLATGGAGPRVSTGTARSGSITGAVTATSATGGGGASTDSGSLTTTTANATGGGGAGGPSASNALTAGIGAVQITFANFFNYLSIVAPGTAGILAASLGTSNSVTTWGGGTGAIALTNATTISLSGASLFGGTGGVACGQTSVNMTSGDVTWSGGTGGVALSLATAGTAQSGRGGNALILAAFYPRVAP